VKEHGADEVREASTAVRTPAPLAEAIPARTGVTARNDLLRLQRLAGNRAVAGYLGGTGRAPGPGRRSAPLSLQRHAPGTELPQKEQKVAEIRSGAAPSATRTSAEAKTQKAEGETAGKEYQKAQKLTPGAMSLASAQKVLQGQFGDVKDIVPGTIVVLADQPACSAKYDEVCMADGILHNGVAWQPGDCAKDDAAAGVQTEGFAWKGVVYVNGATTLVTATTHEMLHNNTGAGFRDKMGETFNEGTTEMLARQALESSEVKVPAVTAYPTEVKLAIQLKELLGTKTLTDAYFNGPDALIKAFEDLKGAGTWATLKGYADTLDVAQAMAAMSKSLKSWWRRK